MNVLILGANGFIGSNLSEPMLANKDWHIYAIDMAADKWEGKVDPDRVTRELSDRVIISVSVRKRIASETDIYVAEILAEKVVGPRWLDVGKEQRVVKETV